MIATNDGNQSASKKEPTSVDDKEISDDVSKPVAVKKKKKKVVGDDSSKATKTSKASTSSSKGSVKKKKSTISSDPPGNVPSSPKKTALKSPSPTSVVMEDELRPLPPKSTKSFDNGNSRGVPSSRSFDSSGSRGPPKSTKSFDSSGSRGPPKSTKSFDSSGSRASAPSQRTFSPTNSNARPQSERMMGGRGDPPGGRGRGRGPPGRGGRGRGRAAPSDRNVQRHSSMPDGGPNRRPSDSSAPPKMQSMMQLNNRSGQPPPNKEKSVRPPPRPASMMHMNNGSMDPPAGPKRPSSMRGPPQRNPGDNHSAPQSSRNMNRDSHSAPQSSRNPKPQSMRVGIRSDFDGPPASNRNISSSLHSPRGPSGAMSSGLRAPSRTESYRAPGKPQSILRSSNHGEKRSSFARSPSINRVNPDGSISSVPSSGMSDLDTPESIPEEEGDGDLMRPMMDRTPSKFQFSQGSSHTRNGSSVRIKGGNMDLSGHSQGKTGLSRFASTRSVLTQDREREYDDESALVTFLRYIRIMAPHRHERPIKKKIRILTWVCLGCDMLAALVSIGTYKGVSYCCDVPILSISGSNINWDLAVRITTYIYVIMIFAEIFPVLTQGMPFNLINPLIGFMITFAVFFNDRITEAVIMWVIEVTAVICEVGVYRLEVVSYNEREERLGKCEVDLKPFMDKRKSKKAVYLKSKRNLMRDQNKRDLSRDPDDNSSSSSESGNSFNDDFNDEDIEEPTDLTQLRELKLLRERRILRQTQSAERRALRYHFAGVSLNVGLTAIAMLLIILIARSGGLCIFDMQAPNFFKKDQIDKCYECKGVEGNCEICRDDGTSQCYFSYY